MRAFEEQFLTFIARGELRYPRCTRTGAALALAARPAADAVEWVVASGEASLYSFVIYHQAYDPAFQPPYNVALVQLAEGPRLVSTVVDVRPSALAIGMRLRAAFRLDGLLIFRSAGVAPP